MSGELGRKGRGTADHASRVVIAHRGASAYLPEHTLCSKAVAHAMGADFIEQDVVMSRDGELIVLHDITLDRTTDVAEIFPHRARADGLHYVVDFDLAELRQLRVSEGFVRLEGGRQPIYPDRFPVGLSEFRIHTLSEEIELIQGMNRSTGRNAGIYPEIKLPGFHRREGHDLSAALLQVLKDYGYSRREDPVFVQTFDYEELRRLRTSLLPAHGMELNLVQLIGGLNSEWMLESGGLEQVAACAEAIGPEKSLLLAPESGPDYIVPSELASQARALGLRIHPYTFRLDQGLIPDYARDFEHLLEIFYFEIGVEGVFTDFPDRAVKYLEGRHSLGPDKAV